MRNTKGSLDVSSTQKLNKLLSSGVEVRPLRTGQTFSSFLRKHGGKLRKSKVLSVQFSSKYIPHSQASFHPVHSVEHGHSNLHSSLDLTAQEHKRMPIISRDTTL